MTILQQFLINYCTKADESDVKSSFDREITKIEIAQALCEFQSKTQQTNTIFVSMRLQVLNDSSTQIDESLIYLRRVLDIDLR